MRTLSIQLDDEAKTITLQGEAAFDIIELLGLAEYLQMVAKYKAQRAFIAPAETESERREGADGRGE